MNTAKDTPYIYGIGETVLDIIFKNMKAVGSSPGGSSFNSMISMGRLGIPCGFVSEVGSDTAGGFIIDFLKQNKVEVSSVLQRGKTAIALAYLNEDSDAQYDFYKDVMAEPELEYLPVLKTGDFLLFGSFYAINTAKRNQVLTMINRAAEGGSIIYYDPNFRKAHIHELKKLLPTIIENMKLSTIVRASDEDIRNIFDVSTGEEAWGIVSEYCDYFIYTRGVGGIDFYSGSFSFHFSVYPVQAVSTIGAGDTLNAGVLSGLFRKGVKLCDLEDLSRTDWEEILELASKMSAEVCLSYDNFIGA